MSIQDTTQRPFKIFNGMITFNFAFTIICETEQIFQSTRDFESLQDSQYRSHQPTPGFTWDYSHSTVSRL